MLLHFPTLLRTEFDEKRSSINSAYRTGAILVLVLKSVFTTWNALLRSVGT